ncbi:MAG: LysR family transcriptional regulator [Pseudomonadota bacterium]
MNRLEAMAAFVAVIDEGSFTAAAEALDISRPKASKLIAELEASLGVRLLNRTTRRVAATEAGRAFHLRCQDILARLDDAVSEASQLQVAPRGELRINAPHSFSREHLAVAIAAFQDTYPDIHVELVLNDRVVDIVDEGFDVAIRIAQLPDSTLVARRLGPCRLMVCAAPDYLGREGTPEAPEDLTKHNCLRYSHLADAGTWRFQRNGKETRVATQGDFRSNFGEAVVAAATCGRGIAMEPTFVVAPLVLSGALVPVLQDYAPRTLGIYAVYPRQRLLPQKVRVFIDFLEGRFGPTPYWDTDLIDAGYLDAAD